MHAFRWHATGRGQMTAEKMMDAVVAWALENSSLRAIAEVTVLRDRLIKGGEVRMVEIFEALASRSDDHERSLYLH